jgi:hypothetical protein
VINKVLLGTPDLDMIEPLWELGVAGRESFLFLFGAVTTDIPYRDFGRAAKGTGQPNRCLSQP